MTDTTRENVEKSIEFLHSYTSSCEQDDDKVAQAAALLLALVERAEKAEADLAALKLHHTERIRVAADEILRLNEDLAALNGHAEAMRSAAKLPDLRSSVFALAKAIHDYDAWAQSLERDLARVTEERDAAREFIAKAFDAHPNLDADIAAIARKP
jgi:chromosome segregation ATPase